LDIGCGIGRIAIPLTNYLNKNGSYEGFDIVKKGVDWCKKNISENYPNFQFLHINLKNDLYNLNTEKEAKNFVFPYKNDDFDLIILTSVFTHMIPEDMENYLFEINRVMKIGGKCLVTFFVLNSESKKFMQANDIFNFKHNFGKYSLLDKNVKEANIAYEENYLLDAIQKNNLKVEQKLYGYWSSGYHRDDTFDFQDTFILTK
jgi:SAM-dependent methyltransferase